MPDAAAHLDLLRRLQPQHRRGLTKQVEAGKLRQADADADVATFAAIVDETARQTALSGEIVVGQTVRALSSWEGDRGTLAVHVAVDQGDDRPRIVVIEIGMSAWAVGQLAREAMRLVGWMRERGHEVHVGGAETAPQETDGSLKRSKRRVAA